mgnify:CR=1 FL=1
MKYGRSLIVLTCTILSAPVSAYGPQFTSDADEFFTSSCADDPDYKLTLNSGKVKGVVGSNVIICPFVK